MANVAEAGPPAPFLGVRFTLLRRGSSGQTEPADPAALRRGEPVWLVFEPNDAGYLYVYEFDAAGSRWRLLAGERLERRARREVLRPGSAGEEAGVRELIAVYTRRPLPDAAAADPLQIAETARASLVTQWPQGRGVAYVVNTGSRPQSQQVVVGVTLSFR